MHLLKPKEIIRIHDAVIERFGGLKTSPMAPEEWGGARNLDLKVQAL